MPPRKRIADSSPNDPSRDAACHGSTQSKDPFSTPARRRRVIADVARFLLRQYCVKACKNVLISRQRSAAAVVIQSALRCMTARKVFHQKRLARWVRCAILIQVVWRAFLARRELWRRREEHRICVRKAAAITVQCWYRQAMAVRILKDLRVRRRDAACRIIQQMYRGHLARKLYCALYDLAQQLKLRRYAAATRIQCCARVRSAKRHLQWRRENARSLRLIHRAVLRWWWKRQRRLVQESSTALLQRCARGLIGRRHARRIRGIRAEQRRVEELARRRERFEMMDQDGLAPEPSGTVELSLELPRDLLRHLRQTGPAAVAKWSLEQNIFCIDNVTSTKVEEGLELTGNSVCPRLCYGNLVRRVLGNLLDMSNDLSDEGARAPSLLSVQRQDAVIADDVVNFVSAMAHKDDDDIDNGSGESKASIGGRIKSHMVGRDVNSSVERKQSEKTTDIIEAAVHCLDGFSNMWGRLYPFGADVFNIDKKWCSAQLVHDRASRGFGLLSANNMQQCVHHRFFRRVKTCHLCRRRRAVNILNELVPRRGDRKYCGKIKFEDTTISARDGIALQLKVTIHGLKEIELYQHKPNVVCHVESDGKTEKYFLEEKVVLLLVEGLQDGSTSDGLDFRVNNSLLKVSFYDRGLQMAAKPPVLVYTDGVDIVEDTETELEEWCIRGQTKKSKRPQTARVMHMLVVEEEVAEIIPYDEKATLIQCMGRCWLARRRLAREQFIFSQRRIICTMAYRRAVLRRWRTAVRDVLYRAHFSAIRIQRQVRGRRGRRLCADRRAEHCLWLWDEAKREVLAQAVSSCPLNKLDANHPKLTVRSRYRLLEDYAKTLNISYSPRPYSPNDDSEVSRSLPNTENSLRDFVQRQPTAGWSADLQNILDLPPPMPGCVSSSELLLVPAHSLCSSGQAGAVCGLPETLSSLLVPDDNENDCRTWRYPSEQHSVWRYSKLRDTLSAQSVPTVERVPSSKVMPPTQSSRGTSASKSSVRRIEKGVDTRPGVYVASKLSGMDQITQHCTGLGDVSHAVFKAAVDRKQINSTLLSHYGFADDLMLCPLSTGVTAISRGRTPPVPPSGDLTHSQETTIVPVPDCVSLSNSPSFQSAEDINLWSLQEYSFLPTLLTKL